MIPVLLQRILEGVASVWWHEYDTCDDVDEEVFFSFEEDPERGPYLVAYLVADDSVVISYGVGYLR